MHHIWRITHIHTMFEVHPPKCCRYVLVLHMRRTAIANVIAKSNLRLRHTNAKESYSKIHNTNETIHHIWYTRHIHNILEMYPQQYCPHVFDLHVRRRAIANFTASSTPSNRFETNRRFIKDIQIKIVKPKYMESYMKSKPRHIDGGVGNLLFI